MEAHSTSNRLAVTLISKQMLFFAFINLLPRQAVNTHQCRNTTSENLASHLVLFGDPGCLYLSLLLYGLWKEISA